MTSSAPHVAVHATAHRDVTPDRFEAIARVACHRAAAGDAAQALAAGFARVEETLTALPRELEVTTRRSAVSQQRVDHPDRDPEWIAARTLTLISPDVGQAGAVLAPFAALIGVVDGLELHGPSWQLDQDNPVHGELQAEAVQQARVRATRYAAALGATLGRLIQVADPSGPSGWPGARAVPMSYGGGEGFETMDFTPEPIAVEVSVDASWTLILP